MLKAFGLDPNPSAHVRQMVEFWSVENAGLINKNLMREINKQGGNIAEAARIAWERIVKFLQFRED